MSAESDIPTELGPAVNGLSSGQVVFGRYELRRKLGEGGFGAVWLVYDSVLQEEVAFKFVLQAVAASPEAIDALKAEASRSRKLTHPHIVRIHDFVSDAVGDALPTLAGISMEYVDGESLAQRRLREPGKCFDTGQIASWIEQACHALTYAHAPKRRVIHRDLKPPNLLVTTDGELKVADFGIACSLINSVTQISGRLSSGTPPFMSPQQLGGDWPSETDDVYSLGASIYMLLTGTPPFHQGDIVHQVMNKVPVSMRERRAQLGLTGRAAIPTVWEETVAACLAKDAARRPQNAEAVAQSLGLRGGQATAATVPEIIRVGDDRLDQLPTRPAPVPTMSTPEPPTLAEAGKPAPDKRTPLWLAAALLAIFVAAFVVNGVWSFVNRSRTPAGAPNLSSRATPVTQAASMASGVSGARPAAVRLLFPKNPGFFNYDREREWGTLRADAWGYLDEEGREVIPAQWFVAARFSEGLASVFRKEDTTFGFIDIAGETVIDSRHQWLANGVFTEGRARVRHPTLPGVGFIDAQGKIVIPLEWELADDFTEGLTVVQGKGKCAFLDLNGQPLTSQQWESATRFSEGLAGVQTGGQWGFIDRQGKLVIPAQWQAVYPFSEGLAAVASAGKFGFIDRTGKVAVKPQWSDALPMREGLAVIKDNGKYGFVDPGGNIVSLLEWDEAQPFSEGRAMVKKNGKVGFLDPLGKVVIPLQFDLAGSFFQGVAMAKRAGGQWGCIDPDGRTIIPFNWNYIESFKAFDGRLFLALARIHGPDPVPGSTNIPAEVRWVDPTGRVLWQSP